MEAQLTATKLPLRRSDKSCTARETSSLPVPLSRVMSTVTSARLTCSMTSYS